MPTIFTVNIPNFNNEIKKIVEKGILSFLDIIPKTEYISIYPKYSLGLYNDNYRESLKGWLTNDNNDYNGENIIFSQMLTNIYQQTINQWGEDANIHIILVTTLDSFKGYQSFHYLLIYIIYIYIYFFLYKRKIHIIIKLKIKIKI